MRVYREYATHVDRRIDILVRFGNSFAIGIENKPWAYDQPGQIEDYVEYLRGRFNDNFVSIYLSPNGEDPTAKSIDKTKLDGLKGKQQFASIFYKVDLSEWLKNCREECEAEKVRIFLGDFMSYIDKFFKEETYE